MMKIRVTLLVTALISQINNGYAATLQGDWGVSTTGYVSASTFYGDGSNLSNLSAGSSITSGTTQVSANSSGYISLTTAGTTTGYFDTAGLLIAPGISLTTLHGISSTNGYFSRSIGIGKANPGALLQLETTGSTPSQIRVGATGTGTAGIYLDAQDGDFVGSDYASFYQEDAGAVYLKNNGPNPLYFSTSNTQRVTIDSAGLVGIGTTNPSYTLDILPANNYMRLHASDSIGEVLIGNGTNVTGYYAPSFYGRPINPARSLAIVSEIQSADDTGTNPTLTITSRVTPSTLVGTRPTISFRNNSRTDMQIEANGYVSIGHTSPTYEFDVSGTVSANQLIIDNVTDIGYTNAPPIYIRGTGGGNDDLSIYSHSDTASPASILTNKSRGTYSAPSAVLTGDYLTSLTGKGHDGVSYYGGALYQRAEADFTTSVHDTYWTFLNGNGSTLRTTMKIASTGITTIYGTSTCVIGSGTGATSCTSDRRLKKDIKPLHNSLEKIIALQGVSFNWKKTGEHAIGVIAQDVEQQFPEVVTTDPETGMKSVSYPSLVAPLIESVKALKAENDALKTELQALRSDVEALKAATH